MCGLSASFATSQREQPSFVNRYMIGKLLFVENPRNFNFFFATPSNRLRVLSLWCMELVFRSNEQYEFREHRHATVTKFFEDVFITAVLLSGGQEGIALVNCTLLRSSRIRLQHFCVVIVVTNLEKNTTSSAEYKNSIARNNTTDNAISFWF